MPAERSAGIHLDLLPAGGAGRLGRGSKPGKRVSTGLMRMECGNGKCDRLD
jgi:hypothetical protein